MFSTHSSLPSSSSTLSGTTPPRHRVTRQFSLATSDYQFLRLERRGATMIVTMDRPNIHNAFSEYMISELTSAFNSISESIHSHIQKHPIADTDPNTIIRSVILTGAGPSFSAGADLNWMKKMAGYSHEENKRDSLALFDMFKAIYDCPVPVIARVNGVALGGGAGLVAAADIAVAVEKAKFGFTEVGIGLIPAVISRFCVDKIGATNAARYFVTGERFKADEARRIGLIQETGATLEDVDAIVERLATTINNNSPNAVRAAKALWKNVLEPGQSVNNSETRDFTAHAIASIRVSEEGQAGLSAFLNKQSPPWALPITEQEKPKM